MEAYSTGVTSAPASFDLTIYDPCSFADITFAGTVLVDFTYTLWDANHPDLVWTDANAA